MTDNERLNKLEQALRLLRDVEFSYEHGDPIRTMFCRVMVERFSLSDIGELMSKFKEAEKAKRIEK